MVRNDARSSVGVSGSATRPNGRSMLDTLKAGVDRAVRWASERELGWRSVVLAVLGVIVVVGAIALTRGAGAPNVDPIADASASADETAVQSQGTPSETPMPSDPSASASSSSAPTTPTPPPTGFPVPTPSSTSPATTSTPRPTAPPTPSPASPGTLTFRVHVDSVGESLAAISIYVVTAPAQPRYFGPLEVCNRFGEEPCEPGIFELHLTGLTAATRVHYAVWATTVGGGEGSAFSEAASHLADGSAIDLHHPDPASLSGTMSYRVHLTSVPPATRAYTLYVPRREGAPDRYELCGPSTSPCAPGTYERTLTDYQPRYRPFAYYALERTTEAGDIRVTNAGVAPIDGSLVEITGPPPGQAPLTLPASPVCGSPAEGDLATDGWVGYHALSWREFTAPRERCVSFMTLVVNTAPGIGTVTLEIDGIPVFIVDLGRWYSYGVDGAGSGDRVIGLTIPMWVATGQTLALDYASCVACETVSMQVRDECP